MPEIKISELVNFNANPRQQEAWDKIQEFDFLLYGGAAGGGKSYFIRWALVLLLIQWYQTLGLENIEVGLFCEDYPALKDRQLSKIAIQFPEWLGSHHADHKEHGNCYILTPDLGSGIIKFRNLDDPSKYQSAEFAAIGVDELTKNPKNVFDFLRLRKRWVGIPHTKFIGGTNPGGIGHLWVKNIWLDGVFEPTEREADQFVFVPAKVSDNPFLDRNYLITLDGLPEKMRIAYKDGSWDVFEGQFFSEWDKKIHIIDEYNIPSEYERFIAIDYGYSKPASVGWYACGFEGQLIRYKEIYITGATYLDLGLLILAKNGNDKINYAVADPAIWGDRPHYGVIKGESGGEMLEKIFNNNATYSTARKDKNIPNTLKFPLRRADNSREVGWVRMREYLKPFQDSFGKITAKLLITKNCKSFINTIPTLVFNKNNPEDLDSDGEDHAADECRYGLMSRPKIPKRAPQPKTETQKFWDKVRKDRDQHLKGNQSLVDEEIGGE